MIPDCGNDTRDCISRQTPRDTETNNWVSVLLAHWTAWLDAAARMNFRRDVYGQNAQWAAGLDAAFQIRRRPLAEVTID